MSMYYSSTWAWECVTCNSIPAEFMGCTRVFEGLSCVPVADSPITWYPPASNYKMPQ